MAVNNSTMELATGGVDGSVDLWACGEWTKTLSFKTKLGGQVLSLKFGELKTAKPLLMVSSYFQSMFILKV